METGNTIVQVEGGSVWLFILLRLIEGALFLLMTILWLRSMQRAMEACHPVSRSGEPASVWLTLIPVFGFIWQFISNTKVSESLAREYHRRGWHSDEDRPGMELGIVAGVVICVVVAIRSVFFIHPGLGFIGTLAMCFCMYRHMDRLNSYRERLEKEFDPTTAFGQIPTMSPGINYVQNFPTVPLGPPPIYVNPAPIQKQAYPHIPFAPQSGFVPPETNQANEKTAKDQDGIPDELKKWMPKNDNPN
ncbi:MAG TPA: hypothetical protein VFJ43_08080 [Bacteroidia bacterium]|nr:hypothetical protein [Bacteroidia bacterium]